MDQTCAQPVLQHNTTAGQVVAFLNYNAEEMIEGGPTKKRKLADPPAFDHANNLPTKDIADLLRQDVTHILNGDDKEMNM